jgi:hypothetical protein
MAVQRARYMTLKTIAPLSDDPVVGLPGPFLLRRIHITALARDHVGAFAALKTEHVYSRQQGVSDANRSAVLTVTIFENVSDTA